MKIINNKILVANENMFFLGFQDKENSCSPCIGVNMDPPNGKLSNLCVRRINDMLGRNNLVCYAATSLTDHRLRITSYPYKISLFINSYIKLSYHETN